MSRIGFLAASAGFAALVIACSSADPNGGALVTDGIEGAPPSGQSSNTGGQQCTDGSQPALKPEDPAKYPAGCCAEQPNGARCVPKTNIPAAMSSQLDGCDSGAGVCVPDAQIKSGGAAPKACKAALNLDGVCLSACVPALGKHPQRALLEQATKDQCAAGEICAPCVDPLNGNKPTGACDIGKASSTTCTTPTGGTTGGGTGPGGQQVSCPYVGPPLVDGNSFPACSQSGNLRCVPTNLVPAAQAGQLEGCDGGKGLCAPKKSVEAAGNYLPKTCKSLAAAEGRCLPKDLKAVKAQADKLPKDVCDADELCAPCFDPLSGKESGACSSVSCDKPTQGAVKFKDCCSARGKCVPTSAVPASQASRLERGEDNAECTEAELCAPLEGLDPVAHKPQTCNVPASNLILTQLPAYSGVCLSKCTVHTDGLIEGIGVRQGNCGNDMDCFPCKDPRTGAPTNAPGCPANP